MIIFGSVITAFEVSNIWGAAGTAAEISSSLKSNCNINLSLSKLLKFIVCMSQGIEGIRHFRKSLGISGIA